MKMKEIIRIGAALVSSAAVLAGCAKETTAPTNEAEKRYFDAWMHVNHPDLAPTDHWVYILKDTPGTGEDFADGFIFVTYTARDLSGNITATTDSTMARLINSYQPQNYYGPAVWNSTSMQSGIYYGMEGMKTGGERSVIIPGWLMTYSRYSSEEEYLANVTGSNAIYDIKFIDRTDDITQWQIDSMSRFVEKDRFSLFSEISPSDTTETGFYYEGQIFENGVLSGYDVEKLDTDTTSTLFSTDTTVYINYTGRLLNGQVFDTSKETVAKDYNIYSSSRTYEPVLITWSDSYSGLTMGSDNTTVITGFAKTLWRMSCVKGVEKAVGLFYSDFGYGYSGSGNLIPAYAPLIFEIEFTENPEE